MEKSIEPPPDVVERCMQLFLQYPGLRNADLLTGDLALLELFDTYHYVLDSFGIKQIKDMYEQELTCQKLSHLRPADLCDHLNDALKENQLPPISALKPDLVLAAYVRQPDYAALSKKEVGVLQNCFFDDVPREAVASELNLGGPCAVGYLLETALEKIPTGDLAA